jgi:hypothetical protein
MAARRRPTAVPSLSLETAIVGPGQAPIADPAVARAVQSFQRSFQKIEEPIRLTVSHPTLRDQIVAATLKTGASTIAHGLGRSPRFVYVTLVDPLPNGWLSWSWRRRDGDGDRDSVSIVLANDAGLGALSLAALVRME